MWILVDLAAALYAIAVLGALALFAGFLLWLITLPFR